MRLRTLTAVGLILSGLGACSHHRDRDNFASIGGAWAGQLRAGDIVGHHAVALNVTQYDRQFSGPLTYDSRTLTVTGEVGYANGTFTITEAGCTGQVAGSFVISSLGLTWRMGGGTSCGIISASGLLER